MNATYERVKAEVERDYVARGARLQDMPSIIAVVTDQIFQVLRDIEATNGPTRKKSQ